MKGFPILSPVFTGSSELSLAMQAIAKNHGDRIVILDHQIAAMSGDPETDVGTVLLLDGTMVTGQMLDTVEV